MVIGNTSGQPGILASVPRVADGSFTLHDDPSRRAALYAIDLQRVYAALDLTRSRLTLYMLAVGRALVLTLVVGPILHRLTVPDRDERQVAGGATARRHEQGDFGSDVEAEPEQATQGYMCHGFVTASVARPYKRLVNRRELSRSSSSVSS